MIYRTSTEISRVEENILHVKLGLDEIIGSKTGYPKYLRESHKIDKLLIKLRAREAMVKQIRLEEEDIIIRDNRIRVQETGIKNVKTCSIFYSLSGVLK